MIAPNPTLRDSTTIGRFRVEVWQEHAGSFRMELRELVGKDWILMATDRESTLDAALGFAAELAAGLREKVNHQT